MMAAVWRWGRMKAMNAAMERPRERPRNNPVRASFHATFMALPAVISPRAMARMTMVAA
jgi:hypothetical protein